MTDPPALAFACNIAGLGCANGELRNRLSLNNASACPRGANPGSPSLSMNTPTLGEPRFASRAGRHAVSDDIRIPEHIEAGADPGLQFELAGPRAKLFFDGKKTRAGHCYVRRLMPGTQQRYSLAVPRAALWLWCKRGTGLSRRLYRARSGLRTRANQDHAGVCGLHSPTRRHRARFIARAGRCQSRGR